MTGWTDEARRAAAEARKAKTAAHQQNVEAVGRPVVSNKVLDVIRKNPHGFSVTPTGDQPKRGYMVAQPGRSHVLNDSELSSERAHQIIDDYVRKNRDVLSQPGAHIGGWRDNASGKTYLDVSQNISRARDAVKAGKARNQIAIWDVRRKRELRTGGTGN